MSSKTEVELIALIKKQYPANYHDVKITGYNCAALDGTHAYGDEFKRHGIAAQYKHTNKNMYTFTHVLRSPVHTCCGMSLLYSFMGGASSEMCALMLRVMIEQSQSPWQNFIGVTSPAQRLWAEAFEQLGGTVLSEIRNPNTDHVLTTWSLIHPALREYSNNTISHEDDDDLNSGREDVDYEDWSA